MEQQRGKLNRKFLLFVISFLGTGLVSKKMPGTIGSFFAMLLLFAVPTYLLFPFALIFFILGWLFCDAYIVTYKYESNRDPGYVVIDEACGIFIGAFIILFFGFYSTFHIVLNFVLFRFFDILKPFPIKLIESKLKQNKKTIGLGIMLDDVIAAIFAGILQIIIYSPFYT